MKKTSQYSEEAETRPTDKTSISFQKFIVSLSSWKSGSRQSYWKYKQKIYLCVVSTALWRSSVKEDRNVRKVTTNFFGRKIESPIWSYLEQRGQKLYQ